VANSDARAAAVAQALRQEAQVRHLAAELAAVGIDVLLLKGPPVQRRLLGTAAAYPSADVDVLVRHSSAAAARRALTAAGWTFISLNGRLWRVDGAAAYLRDGVQVDVHWRLHVGLVSPRRLDPLRDAMWDGAVRTDEGWWEPPLPALTTYLTLHSADRLGHEGKWALTEAAVRAAGDAWPEVERLARRCGMSRVLDEVVRALEADDHQGIDPLELVYGRRRAALVQLVRRRLPTTLDRVVARIRRR
jgi:hypothetical protein